MTRHPSIHRRLAAVAAGTLVVLAAGASAQETQQGTQQPPTPRPEHQDPQQREQERLERERLEQERLRQQQRQQEEQQRRIEEARRQQEQRTGQPDPRAGQDRATPREASAPIGDQRAIARQLFDIERRHRALLARMDRIAEIYQEQGETERLQELEQLRQMQNQRYMTAQQRFREQLGPQSYARLQSMMQQSAQAGRPELPGARGRDQNQQQRQDR